MDEMYKLCEVIKTKLEEIAEKGLTTANLENAYKLVDMYKDLKEAEYYQQAAEGGYSEARRRDSRGRFRSYSRDGGESYNGGSSYNHSRYSRNGYDYDNGGSYGREDMHRQYMDAKRSYRTSGSGECKKRLMETLDQYMDDFAERMETMLKDSDCKEERETINRYLQKIKNFT